MMKYWGLVLHMGIVKKPELRQYWSIDILYQTPVFGMVMNRKRFEAIHKFLHFRDNTDILPRDDPNFDRLFKIRPVIEHFSNKFAEVYIPQREICVDESLIHFKGRLQFRQYLPSKRARYGIKLYKICESTSGYTLSFRVYQGKDSSIQPPDCPPALGGQNGQKKYQISLKSSSGPISVLLINKDSSASKPVAFPVPPPDDITQPQVQADASSALKPSTQDKPQQTAEDPSKDSQEARTNDGHKNTTTGTFCEPPDSFLYPPLSDLATTTASSSDFLPLDVNNFLKTNTFDMTKLDDTEGQINGDLIDELMSSDVFPLLRLSPTPGDDYNFNLDDSEGVCDLFDVQILNY
ncbi:unnamed protein product [Ranitomeya imitator]|uniref:PiggyBac transposable element-derived protein domain-containing protein n=1 Tax=Ranitomeya imitator TaxID=111125 RepID=A0ABN9ME47_9NEOB|nr:unnamed protein product [Ranitomeya imitator]